MSPNSVSRQCVEEPHCKWWDFPWLEEDVSSAMLVRFFQGTADFLTAAGCSSSHFVLLLLRELGSSGLGSPSVFMIFF